MKTALITDLTALYYAGRSIFKGKKQLDYILLDNYLKDSVGISKKSNWDFNINFSVIDSENETQKKFLKFLNDSLHWNISTKPSTELNKNESEQFRFSSNISFILGKNLDNYDAFVLLSDSYDLVDPVTTLCENGKIVYIAFFNEYLDPRWYRRLFYDERIGFIDLQEINGELYSPKNSILK